jgi:hypothetical protein
VQSSNLKKDKERRFPVISPLLTVVEVNGDFRIGIYARELWTFFDHRVDLSDICIGTNLQAGEEVTINYGPDFFRTRT